MKMKKWKIATASAILLASALLGYSLREASQPEASETMHKVDLNEIDTTAAEGDTQQNGDLPSSASTAREYSGLGGSGLNLQSSIRDAIAIRGRDDPSISAMVSIAQTTCDEEPSTLKSSSRHQEWAKQYLAVACEGFDAGEFGHPLTAVDIAATARENGETAATQLSIDQLKQPENMLTLTLAGWYLIEKEKFPNQDQYGVDKEQLARMFSAASGLRMCDSMNACGTNSLLTAQICSTHECPEGATYEKALRLNLTPMEYRTVNQLKNSLAVQR